MFVLYLVKAGNDLLPYNIVSTAFYMKSPYKSPVVTSDTYQETLRVIRKRAVYVIKANV